MNPYLSLARRILLTAAASLLLAGCSGLGLDSLFGPSEHSDSESLFGPDNQPYTITQGTINLMPGELVLSEFETYESGSLAVTVDWGEVDHSIELLLYSGPCAASPILTNHPAGTCSNLTLVAAADQVPVVKPNVLLVTNLARGIYTLALEHVDNGSAVAFQEAETGPFSIILSPLSSPSS